MKTQEEIIVTAQEAFPHLGEKLTISAACFLLTVQSIEELVERGLMEGTCGLVSTESSREICTFLEAQGFNITQEQIGGCMTELQRRATEGDA